MPDLLDANGYAWAALIARIGALRYERREWKFGGAESWPGGHYWTWYFPEFPAGEFTILWKDRPPALARLPFTVPVLVGRETQFGCGPEVNRWREVEH